MFLKDEKRSPGWGLMIVGLALCAFSLLGITGAFGPLPASGRFTTLTIVGIPVGVVAIVIGIVRLSRDGRDERPKE